jgi:hypothetical protein
MSLFAWNFCSHPKTISAEPEKSTEKKLLEEQLSSPQNLRTSAETVSSEPKELVQLSSPTGTPWLSLEDLGGRPPGSR